MRIALLPSFVLAAGLLAACGQPSSGSQYSHLNAKLPPVGQPLPALTAATLDGKSVTNESLHGKTVLLNVWFFH